MLKRFKSRAFFDSVFEPLVELLMQLTTVKSHTALSRRTEESLIFSFLFVYFWAFVIMPSLIIYRSLNSDISEFNIYYPLNPVVNKVFLIIFLDWRISGYPRNGNQKLRRIPIYMVILRDVE